MYVPETCSPARWLGMCTLLTVPLAGTVQRKQHVKENKCVKGEEGGGSYFQMAHFVLIFALLFVKVLFFLIFESFLHVRRPDFGTLEGSRIARVSNSVHTYLYPHIPGVNMNNLCTSA